MRQAARPRPRSRIFWKIALAFGVLALSTPMIHNESAVFAADEAVVRGVVRDAGGAPIAGAQIRMVDPTIAKRCPDLLVGSTANLWLAAGPDKPAGSEAIKSRTTRSNAEGQFEISREPDSAPGILLILAEGFAPHLEALGGGQFQKVTLEGGSDLELRLVTELEKPVEDAEVTLVPLTVCGPVVEAFFGLLVSHASGNPDGKVLFRNVPGGTYALRLSGKERLTSNVAPLVVGTGDNRFRLRVPWGRALRGKVEYPSHTVRSSGSIVAFWKDPEGGLQWTEAPLSGDEGDFELNGLSYEAPTHLLARTGSGLSSRIAPLSELPQVEDALKNPIPLILPADWQGRLPDGIAGSSLVVEFLLPSFSPSGFAPDAITVPIGTDRRFVIPDVPRLVHGLRLFASGYGEARVQLQENSSGDLGLIQFDKKHTLRGRVTWEDQSPLVAAEIEAVSASGSLCRVPVTRSGDFVCPTSTATLRDLRYRAWVGNTAFQMTPRSGNSVPSFIATAGVSIEALVSRPGDHGRAEDLGLEIVTGPAAGDKLNSRQSDRYARSPDGHLSLHVVGVGKVKLTLSNPEGGAGTSAAIDFSADAAARKIKVSLSEGPKLFGTVKAAASGKSIESAEIELGPTVDFDDRVNVSRISSTNGDGAWRQEDVREGDYQILASAPGYADAQKRVLVPREAGLSQDFLLRSPGRIHGKVLGLQAGKIATVTASPSSAWTRWIVPRTDLDSKGEFTLDGVRPDRYSLTLLVKKPHSKKDLPSFTRRNKTVEVEAGATTEVEFDLRGGIVITGQAYLGMKPAKNSSVMFTRRAKHNTFFAFERTSTGDQGQYEVHVPGPDSYLVLLQQEEPDQGWRVELDRELTIGGATTQTQDLHFSDGQILGRVLDSTGKPVSAAYVDYFATVPGDDSEGDNRSKRQGARGAECHEDGSFQIRPLASGDYHLEVVAKGFATRKLDPLALNHDQTVDLQNVILDPELSIAILAQGPGGGALSQAYVNAYDESATEFSRVWGSPKTEENGLARIDALSPGTYTVVGVYPGLAPAYQEDVKVPLKEPAAPLTLQFAPGGSLDVRIVRRNGEPVPDAGPQILDSRGREVTMLYSMLAALSGGRLSTDTAGHAILDAMRPGEYSIKAWQGSKSEPRTVTVKAGQTTSVVLVAEGEEGD